ncbi:phosphoribosyltransferase [Nocardiopsis alba]|uniref:phosphoribosyltransferase n=1 Tax=Nocardiopsis alba TaxID=53437 RepID=UPI00366D3BE4
MSSSDAAFNARVVERHGVPVGGRTERVIHTLDGLESPVLPDTLEHTGKHLWSLVTSLVDPTDMDFLLGLDAGGIVPTLALSHVTGLPYKIAWKLRLPLPGAVRFTEPHAVRTDVYAYGIHAGQRMVIVDDEITTGRTLADLAVRLRQAGADPLAAVCLVEDPDQGARRRLEAIDLPLVALHRLQRDS